MSRRTKVVCTIGPASSNPHLVRNLIRAGMNVARLNFSHGTHEYHLAQIHMVREAAKELGVNVAIMVDLQGPKIRTGPLEGGGTVLLEEGKELTITTRTVPGSADEVSTTYKHLPADVNPGDRILIADGTLELRVVRVDQTDVTSQIVRGGLLGQHKGLNLPGVDLAASALTPKDEEDLAFAMAHCVDYVALSFVRKANDIRKIKGIIDAAKSPVGVVAKIERPEALTEFNEIVELSDAVMVARGDLGVEVPFEDVPMIQKRLISKCNEMGVPVITATQMLESMLTHSRPTRAEVTDVANAILDGTDAVMLSGETAAGQFPIQACATMAKIAAKLDEEIAARPGERLSQLRVSNAMRAKEIRPGKESYADAIGQAVVRMASALKLARIVCFTTTGYTAAAIARYRPATEITAITPVESTFRKLALLWGVSALKTEDIGNTDEMVARVEQLLLMNGMGRIGETIIIVAGTPLAAGGRTNLLKLHTLGEQVE